jgi:hypothetical protein
VVQDKTLILFELVVWLIETMSLLEQLPTELLQYIFSFVPSMTALGLPLVCRRFHTVCEDGIVWRQVFQNSEKSYKANALTKVLFSNPTWLWYVKADARSFLKLYQRSVLPLEQPLTWIPQLFVLKRT